ncbi:MAG: 2-hydroxyglutaryl-CoA dehydratase [Acidobacteria bacterium]|nr:2-hydroxyglutaryl-CoA dehydratase [Acidobacteriota bacterium]
MKKYFTGIDIGSISTEVVILDDNGQIISSAIENSGRSGRDTADRVLDYLMGRISDSKKLVNRIVSTGYGRNQVSNADKTYTEITCHAVAAKTLFSSTDTVLDIGGQDSKAIKISSEMIVTDFQMNDRCAAGSGRFLEVMAHALEMDLAEMDNQYFKSVQTAEINATCTVFAESEVISLLNDGVDVSSIIRGIYRSVARRACQLLTIVKPGQNLTLTGGVSKSKALLEEIGLIFNGLVNLPDDPQIMGAYGAALLAYRDFRD